MMSKLMTVTVTMQFVMMADSDYKDDYSMASRCYDEAIGDIQFDQCEVDIVDYKDDVVGWDDSCIPYGYGHLVSDKTIGELK
jgi:hypothetical protein